MKLRLSILLNTAIYYLFIYMHSIYKELKKPEEPTRVPQEKLTVLISLRDER